MEVSIFFNRFFGKKNKIFIDKKYEAFLECSYLYLFYTSITFYMSSKTFLILNIKKILLQTVKILESYAVIFTHFVVCFSFNIFGTKIFSSIVFYFIFFWLFCVVKVKIISKLKGTSEHSSKFSSFCDLYCFYTNY